MNKELLNAVNSKYTARRDEARANLKVYLSNPVGIGEHGDIVEVVSSDANDHMTTVSYLLKEIENDMNFGEFPKPLSEGKGVGRKILVEDSLEVDQTSRFNTHLGEGFDEGN